MHTHIAICSTSLFIFIYNSGIRQYQQFPIKTMPSGLLPLFFTCTPHPRHLLHLKLVRKADTKHCVDFWSALPAAHGGVHSRFNHLYGSMASGFVHLAAADSKWREVPEQVGKASHKRAVVSQQTKLHPHCLHLTRLCGLCHHSPLSNSGNVSGHHLAAKIDHKSRSGINAHDARDPRKKYVRRR